MWDLSSLSRDWTCTPCIGRQSLNHWTTGEVALLFLILVFTLVPDYVKADCRSKSPLGFHSAFLVDPRGLETSYVNKNHIHIFVIWGALVFPGIKWMSHELEHHFPTCVLGDPPSQDVNCCSMERGFHGGKQFEKHGSKPSELVLFTVGLLGVFTMQMDVDTLQVEAAVYGPPWGASVGRHWATWSLQLLLFQQ